MELCVQVVEHPTQAGQSVNELCKLYLTSQVVTPSSSLHLVFLTVSFRRLPHLPH